MGPARRHRIRPPKAASTYRTAEADERSSCSFGLNPEYVDVLATAGLVVSATDHDGEARVVELTSADQFLVVPLFVPQMRSAPGRPHPLVTAFVEHAIARADRAVVDPPAPPPPPDRQPMTSPSALRSQRSYRAGVQPRSPVNDR